VRAGFHPTAAEASADPSGRNSVVECQLPKLDVVPRMRDRPLHAIACQDVSAVPYPCHGRKLLPPAESPVSRVLCHGVPGRVRSGQQSVEDLVEVRARWMRVWMRAALGPVPAAGRCTRPASTPQSGPIAGEPSKTRTPDRTSSRPRETSAATDTATRPRPQPVAPRRHQRFSLSIISPAPGPHPTY
jgi:hypothetical protein